MIDRASQDPTRFLTHARQLVLVGICPLCPDLAHERHLSVLARSCDSTQTGSPLIVVMAAHLSQQESLPVSAKTGQGLRTFRDSPTLPRHAQRRNLSAVRYPRGEPFTILRRGCFSRRPLVERGQQRLDHRPLLISEIRGIPLSTR